MAGSTKHEHRPTQRKPSVGGNPGLSAKQQAFVAEYLVDLNATQAAIRAGYSARTAEVQGSRLLRNVQVRKATDAALSARAQRVEVKADDVLRELLRLALADPAACFDAEGEPLPLHKMPREARAFIAGVDYEELWEGHGDDRIRLGNIRKLKFWSKPHALELLGKHLKLFTEKLELEAKGNVSISIIRNVASPAKETTYVRSAEDGS